MTISTIRGEVESISGEHVVYFGFARQIPRAAYSADREKAVQTEIAMFQRPILGSDGTMYVPAANQTVDVSESLDPGTGDIWIMFRSPFVPRPDPSESCS